MYPRVSSSQRPHAEYACCYHADGSGGEISNKRFFYQDKIKPRDTHDPSCVTLCISHSSGASGGPYPSGKAFWEFSLKTVYSKTSGAGYKRVVCLFQL